MDRYVEIVDGIALPKISPERWKELKTYPLKPDDVFVCSYLRSGSQWTQQIVRLLRYGIYSDDGRNLDEAIPWLEILGTEFAKEFAMSTKAADELVSPRTFKSHFPYHLVPGGFPHMTPAKYIYVARNPKDVCVSMLAFANKLLPSIPLTWEENLSNFLLKGKATSCYFGGWFNHVLGWWKHKDEPNILFLKYEDMKKEPNKCVQAIAEFIGMEGVMQEQIEEVVRKSSFSNMRNDPAANKSWREPPGCEGLFMRKGVVGEWKNHFTVEQSTHLDEIFTLKMGGSGICFDYC